MVKCKKMGKIVNDHQGYRGHFTLKTWNWPIRVFTTNKVIETG